MNPGNMPNTPNGRRPQQATPSIIFPDRLEQATLMTMSMRIGSVDLVALAINAPGKAFSIFLNPDDAIAWGDKLSQAGRNAKSGLIL